MIGLAVCITINSPTLLVLNVIVEYLLIIALPLERLIYVSVVYYY